MMKCQLLMVAALWSGLLVSVCPALPQYVSHKSCNHKPPGSYVAHPSNCHQYVLCNGLRSTLGSCPEGTFFNPSMLSCDKVSGVCKNNEKHLNQATSTTVTTTTTMTMLAPAAMMTTKVDPTMTTMKASMDPAVTTSSPTTTGTTTTTTTTTTMASASPFFALPAAASASAKKPYSSFQPYGDSATASYVRPVCDPSQDEAYPFPHNCKIYYQCVRGFLIVRQCGQGQGWDVERRLCGPRQQVRCWGV